MAVESWVLLVDARGACCSDYPPAVALFTSRAKAQAVIDEYDDAVRRAKADGVVGVCHVGDYAIADLPIDLESAAELIPPHIYLRDRGYL